ncbi:MAG: ubiquitin-conjugating enzyme E2 [Candidatus Micrarchaeota archaeon]
MPFLPETVFSRRLQAEFAQMHASGLKFTASADKTEYEVSLDAPGFKRVSGQVSPINSHRFTVKIKREYPYAGGLDVVWLTPIFHPNIREGDGKVCIQLVNEWTASQTIASVCAAIIQLLANPNPFSPLNIEAARFFDQNPQALSGKYAYTRPRIISK